MVQTFGVEASSGGFKLSGALARRSGHGTKAASGRDCESEATPGSGPSASGSPGYDSVPPTDALARFRPSGRPELRFDQTSVCSEISKASSTSMPRYLTVDSSLVWPSSNCTARRTSGHFECASKWVLGAPIGSCPCSMAREPGARTCSLQSGNRQQAARLRPCQSQGRDICHGDNPRRGDATQDPAAVQFEITPVTREAVQKWIKQAGLKSDDFVFPSRIHDSPHLGKRQYARILRELGSKNLDSIPRTTARTPMRRTKATLISGIDALAMRQDRRPAGDERTPVGRSAGMQHSRPGAAETMLAGSRSLTPNGCFSARLRSHRSGQKQTSGVRIGVPRRKPRLCRWGHQGSAADDYSVEKPRRVARPNEWHGDVTQQPAPLSRPERSNLQSDGKPK